MSPPTSDPDLLDAYRKQLRNGLMAPGAVFLMWQGQAGITPDDLMDEFKKADAEGVTS